MAKAVGAMVAANLDGLSTLSAPLLKDALTKAASGPVLDVLLAAPDGRRCRQHLWHLSAAWPLLAVGCRDWVYWPGRPILHCPQPKPGRRRTGDTTPLSPCSADRLARLANL